ncbi:hypothetical protein SAMN05216298_5040 [Glycomyces sambucus]|uniref:DUF234 domain-containing protein n=1 Tax=Glycomyces sambucus TaxID=380244 RepID=A0A1G9MMK7_9ACTN|nr:DUF234 domain-containing protein [Glycomyces sambucus]SDL74885.1 hypothetical protein SAMN05216298_5040 [Glycomyces sambucus]
MANGFIGRQAELARLGELLDLVRSGGGLGRPGRALIMRGRRRVGKSRLVEEFAERSGVPYLFYTAEGLSNGDDLRSFAQAVEESTLPDAGGFTSETPARWTDALNSLADVLPEDSPSIVVIDEMPYLIAQDPGFEGALQRAFDRRFSRLPVLLVLIGSDLSVMERVDTYGRPFYQRGTEMVVPPFNPAEIAERTGLGAAEAFDAFLVTGGLPLVLERWEPGTSLWEFVEASLRHPTSPLLVSAERSLSAEFPAEAHARQVLRAIGSGERTFVLIGRAAGELAPTSLKRSLEILAERRIVKADTPLSTRASRETRYRIEDPYLRFWLFFLAGAISKVERGRGDLVLKAIRQGWTSWRGRAIEPVVREALWRLAPDLLPAGTDAVGGYWTRSNNPEIDIVGADREPVAKRVTAVGSVKWLENKPFGPRDYAALFAHRAQLPGADDDSPLLAVARSGCEVPGVTAIGPEDLIEAWRHRPQSRARGAGAQ